MTVKTGSCKNQSTRETLMKKCTWSSCIFPKIAAQLLMSKYTGIVGHLNQEVKTISAMGSAPGWDNQRTHHSLSITPWNASSDKMVGWHH